MVKDYLSDHIQLTTILKVFGMGAALASHGKGRTFLQKGFPQKDPHSQARAEREIEKESYGGKEK